MGLHPQVDSIIEPGVQSRAHDRCPRVELRVAGGGLGNPVADPPVALVPDLRWTDLDLPGSGVLFVRPQDHLDELVLEHLGERVLVL
jgi:hypothetical protein